MATTTTTTTTPIPELPNEMQSMIAAETVSALRLAPSPVRPDHPNDSHPIRVQRDYMRRLAARDRVGRQVDALRPLATVGGAFGAAVCADPIWTELIQEQGWETIGGEGNPTLDFDPVQLACDGAAFFRDTNSVPLRKPAESDPL